MANTFGIDIKPIGVAKYTQENLKPLDSADLSRFFNMSVQKKELDRADNKYKLDVLGQVGTLLKEIDPLPKDLAKVKNLIDPIQIDLSKAKATEDYTQIANRLAKTMLDPIITTSLQEKTLHDKLFKWGEDLAPDQKKLFYEDLNNRATTVDGESIGGMDISKYAAVPNMKEQLQQQQILASQAQMENAKANTEAAVAQKNSQITLNNINAGIKQNTEDTHNAWLKVADDIDKDPNLTGNDKLAIRAILSNDKTTDEYKEALRQFHVNHAYGSLRDAVQNQKGTNPPAANTTSTGDKQLDDFLKTPSVNVLNNETGESKYVDIYDTKGRWRPEITETMTTKKIGKFNSMDEDGKIHTFDPHIMNGKVATVNTEAEDIATWPPFSYGDWSKHVSIQNSGNEIIKPKGGLYNILNKYGEHKIFDKSLDAPNDITAKNQFQIKYQNGPSKDAQSIYINFVPENANSEKEVQKGYLETNNPQVVQKYYNEMVESGLKDAKWFSDNVTAEDTGSGIKYRIKNQIWSARGSATNADPEATAKYIRDNLTGSIFTPAEKKAQAEAQVKAARDAGTTDYIPWEDTTTRKLDTASNKEINRQFNINRQGDILNKIKNIPNLKEPIESFAKLDPTILQTLSQIINLSDPNDAQLIRAISDAADDNRDYGSYHNIGRALDLSVRPELIESTRELINRINNEWPKRMFKDANGNDRKGKITFLVEGPTQKDINATAAKFGFNNTVMAKPNPVSANHIHISFGINTANTRTPTTVDRSMSMDSSKIGTSLDTSGLDNLNLH